MAGQAVSAAGYYLHWGVVQISLTNFLIIVAMIVVFIAALLIPFPARRDHSGPDQPAAERAESGSGEHD